MYSYTRRIHTYIYIHYVHLHIFVAGLTRSWTSDSRGRHRQMSSPQHRLVRPVLIHMGINTPLKFDSFGLYSSWLHIFFDSRIRCLKTLNQQPLKQPFVGRLVVVHRWLNPQMERAAGLLQMQQVIQAELGHVGRRHRLCKIWGSSESSQKLWSSRPRRLTQI